MFRTTKKKPRKKLSLRAASSHSETDARSEDADDVEDTAGNVDGDGNKNENPPNDGNPALVLNRKKKKKRRSGIMIRSFDDDAYAEEQVETTRRAKKRKKGLGFGGAGHGSGNGSGNGSGVEHDALQLGAALGSMQGTRTDTDPGTGTGTGFGGTTFTSSDNDNDNDMHGPTTIKRTTQTPEDQTLGADFDIQGNLEPEAKPSYGKDALEKLKAEQRNRLSDKNKNKEMPKQDRNIHILRGLSTSTITENSVDTMHAITGEVAKAINCRQKLDQFDRLRENTFDYMDMQKQQQSKDVDPDAENVLIDETSDWEDQIARRAGIHTSEKTPKPSTPAAASNLPSLHTLRNQLLSTTVHLRAQQSDVGNAIMRREADLAQLESDFKQHKEALKAVGFACDSYQNLRHELALWVGALRHLQQKTNPIFDAVVDLLSQQYQNNQQEWMDCQDDAVSVLLEAHLLSNTLGRQPQSSVQSEEQGLVDEFGRDVQSQFSREREKRYRSRTARQAFDAEDVVGDRNDSGRMSLWMDEGDFHSRYKILMEAMRVALNELDENYAAVSKLVDVFSRWKTAFPDDFSQCYASLSLGDLLAVLVKVELCRSFWVESMLLKDAGASHDSKHGIFSWWPNPARAESSLESTGGALERVLSKVYVPFLFSLLDRAAGFCFVSSRKSALLSAYVAGLVKSFESGSPWIDKILECLSDSISRTLGCVCIPILKNAELVNEREHHSDSVDKALVFARKEQGEWVQILMLNLLRMWVPLFKNTRHYVKIGDFILGFLSSKYLFLLSSLDKTVASTLLRPIWRHIQSSYSNWLDAPALMLQGAPLRASAAAYGFLQSRGGGCTILHAWYEFKNATNARQQRGSFLLNDTLRHTPVKSIVGHIQRRPQ